MSNLLLIVGLGNPGNEYAQTRHNAGFWFVERLAKQHGISMKFESRFSAVVGRGHVAGVDLRLLMPTTFMNRSGNSVAPFVKFFQIPTPQILIAHDELDLSAGTIRLKTGGGHGGHNGLKDIVPHIGNDFHRLRIGIGHPGHKDKVSGHVLSKPSMTEQQLIDSCIDEALRLTSALVTGQIATAMNQLNAFKP